MITAYYGTSDLESVLRAGGVYSLYGLSLNNDRDKKAELTYYEALTSDLAKLGRKNCKENKVKPIMTYPSDEEFADLAARIRIDREKSRE